MVASSHQLVDEQADRVTVVKTVPVVEQAVIVWQIVEQALVIVVVDGLRTDAGHVTSQDDTVAGEQDELDELEEPVEEAILDESSPKPGTVVLSVR